MKELLSSFGARWSPGVRTDSVNIVGHRLRVLRGDREKVYSKRV